MKIKKEDR